MSQMHFARQGKITEEMAFVAEREKLAVESIREEIAAGRQILADVAAGAFGDWRSIRTTDAAQDFLLSLFLPKPPRQ